MSHDTDKLIRQLSLVAFLMAERRPLTARDVKQNVEGYQEMSDEAFARRFYSDRAELLALGVPLDSQRDEFTGEELYRLSSERYFLPPLELTDEELAALQTCLYLLEGQFAYAEPLRLALQNLALGRPGFDGGADRDRARDRAARPRLLAGAPGPAGEARGRDLEEPDAEVRVLVDHARRAPRAHGQPLRAPLRPRPVVRRRARPRRREGQDVPRLADPRRYPARHAARARLPAAGGLRRRASTGRARPGRSARRRARREIEVGGDTAWWVDRLFGRYGRIEDGVFVTDYSDLGQLSSWILRQDGRAIPLAPPELRRQVRADLDLVHERHAGKPPKIAAEAAQAAAEEEERPASPVPPERFGLLQSLLAYLLDRCGDNTQAVIPASDITSRFNIPPESLEEHLQLLNLVNFGGGCYAVYTELHGDQVHVEKELFGDTFRSPPRLTPLEARAIRLALEFVGPMIAADAHTPLERVRQKLEETFGQFDLGQTAEPRSARAEEKLVATLSEGIRQQRARRDRVSEGRRGHALDAARRAARDRAAAAVLVRPHVGPHAGRAALVPARPDAQRPPAAGDVRAAVRASGRTGSAAPAVAARIWYSKKIARWKAEEGAQLLSTAPRSRTRPSAARSGSSARSWPTAARPSCSSRRTSASRSPTARRLSHASCASAAWPRRPDRRGRPELQREHRAPVRPRTARRASRRGPARSSAR